MGWRDMTEKANPRKPTSRDYKAALRKEAKEVVSMLARLRIANIDLRTKRGEREVTGYARPLMVRKRFTVGLQGRGLLCIGLLFFLLPGTAPAQQGARVLHRNLAQLVEDADTIVRGRVLSINAETHPQLTNLNTIVVKLSVGEVLKGNVAGEFTFRQFVFDIRDRQRRLGYKLGEEVLLMMLKPSRYGLSSPAGLEQGRFRMQRDAQGNIAVVNGWNNVGLMRDMQQTVPGLETRLTARTQQVLLGHKAGPILYIDLKELIQGVIAGRP